MVLTTLKIILFAAAVLNLIFISIFVSLGKNKVAVALAVLEAFLVSSTFLME